MARVVLTDAGPLIALARLDALVILARLFGSVVAPTAVIDECRAKESEDSRRINMAIQTGWIKVETPTLPLPEMPRSLGEGEKQVIALAQAHPQSLSILDDRLARKHAARLGLAFVGTARLLTFAEQQDLIDSAEQSVEALRQSGYRISPAVLRLIRQSR